MLQLVKRENVTEGDILESDERMYLTEVQAGFTVAALEGSSE